MFLHALTAVRPVDNPAALFVARSTFAVERDH